MKHTIKITLILITIFLFTQIFGLYTINNFIEPEVNTTTGVVTIGYPETSVGEVYEPTEEEKYYSPLSILFAVLIGTSLIFLLMKFNIGFLFKYLFLFAIFITLFITFGVYINKTLAFVLALILAIWKVFKPNILVHNFTEMFIYTGVAIAFLAFFNLMSIFILLIIISIYDMIAVWKSKHMIKLAKFQMESKAFAGFSIPYTLKQSSKKIKSKKKKINSSTAILGGGDIAFPLLFSSTAMQYFITTMSMTQTAAFLHASIISIFTTIALALLFLLSKKDRFYPAMPFISAGCFIGYLIAILI